MTDFDYDHALRLEALDKATRVVGPGHAMGAEVVSLAKRFYDFLAPDASNEGEGEGEGDSDSDARIEGTRDYTINIKAAMASSTSWLTAMKRAALEKRLDDARASVDAIMAELHDLDDDKG